MTDKVKDLIKCIYAGDENDEVCAKCDGITIPYLDENNNQISATTCSGYALISPDSKDKVDEPSDIPLTGTRIPCNETLDESSVITQEIKTTRIRAKNGVSVELQNRHGIKRWYKFEYEEEIAVSENANESDIRKARDYLWKISAMEVERQIYETNNRLDNE